MNIIGFHNPDEEYGFLSNWYLSDFSVLGIQYSSMEQYMMHQKAICFHDNTIAAEMLKTNDVSQIKQLGRSVTGFDDNIWNGVRQIIVYEGLKAKFSQNDELKTKLLYTDEAILAECAVKDVIWGIGLSMTDPNRMDIKKWRGQNLLGYALMMVRSRLQA
ncbi:MAG: NADAR family protein [Butyrivibrio sp.]|nr:NADAR family protein [Butyrivibrio sp.]